MTEQVFFVIILEKGENEKHNKNLTDVYYWIAIFSMCKKYISVLKIFLRTHEEGGMLAGTNFVWYNKVKNM